MVLRSKWVGGLEVCAAGGVVLVAAAGDFLGVKGRLWLVALGLLFALHEVLRRMVRGVALLPLRSTLSQVGIIISALASGTDGEGSGPRVLRDPERVIELLLRRAKELVVEVTRIPANHVVAANLLEPVFDRDGNPCALKVSARDDLYYQRKARNLPLDSPGAGVAFCSGTPQALPRVSDHGITRRAGADYTSIAAFPVVVGDVTEDEGRVRAVLTLDSTFVHTFTDRSVGDLKPYLEPILSLIGLALQIRDQRQGEAA